MNDRQIDGEAAELVPHFTGLCQARVICRLNSWSYPMTSPFVLKPKPTTPKVWPYSVWQDSPQNFTMAFLIWFSPFRVFFSDVAYPGRIF